jgi:ketosteroid isomerase-like protein
MKKIIASLLTVVCMISMPGANASILIPGPINGDSVRTAIAEVNRQYGEAYGKGDSSIFLTCYASDACIMAANTPILCGRNAMLAFYRAGYRMGIRNIMFTTSDLFNQTDQYVTEQGVYEMFDSNNQSMGKGKYLVLWKKTALGWKMFRDMFNSDAPPARMAK